MSRSLENISSDLTSIDIETQLSNIDKNIKTLECEMDLIVDDMKQITNCVCMFEYFMKQQRDSSSVIDVINFVYTKRESLSSELFKNLCDAIVIETKGNFDLYSIMFYANKYCIDVDDTIVETLKNFVIYSTETLFKKLRLEIQDLVVKIESEKSIKKIINKHIKNINKYNSLIAELEQAKLDLKPFFDDIKTTK